MLGLVWHASPVQPDSATTINASWPTQQIIQGKKRNCPYVATSYLPHQLCHCRVGYCYELCHVLSILLQVYFHVRRVSSRDTEFENFDAEMLAFLWYVLFENHPSFEGNNNFVNSQIFGRVVKFGKCAI